MDTWVWVAIAVVLAIVIGVALWGSMRKRRTTGLQERFGSEYDRTVESSDRRAAEKDLTEREERRAQLDIRPLAPETRDRYADEWAKVQTRFVDGPAQALGEADRLVLQVMRDRGYPMDDFDQRAADISVDHSDVVENYRSAHAISLDSEQQPADVDTERVREGFVHYRELFAELLGADADADDRNEREMS